MITATYRGGSITKEEVAREASRLPAPLRDQLSSPTGRRELAHSLIDKRLLVAEARRHSLDSDPEIRRQVTELEERLIVQSLLAAEERAAGPPSEAELRTFFDAHKRDLEQPERAKVARILSAVPAAASAAERAKAKARAEKWAARLQGGEPFARVAHEGDGPERTRDGDLGVVTRGVAEDPELARAAFSLEANGKPSAVVACRDGFAVLQVAQRWEARVPPFEEVKAEVEGRVAPVKKRKVFDDLLARLRREADIQDAPSR